MKDRFIQWMDYQVSNYPDRVLYNYSGILLSIGFIAGYLTQYYF